MASVYIKTLGCKVNTYDTNVLETGFSKLGYTLVDSPGKASISILNTCSVTENASKEARYYIRRFRRESPEALIVATGCYAQTDSDRLLEMEDLDMVFPNEVKDRLINSTHKAFEDIQNGKNRPDKLPAGVKAVRDNKQGHFKTSLTMLEADSSQTRAFLKIQDGCNGFCSYCLIPYARGASRSVDIASVKKEVRRLIDVGVGEIVFTGIHIGDFGDDRKENETLVGLMEDLLSWEDMVRVRISSLEPRELDERLLKLAVARPDIFCDHFHLPLQSGHDRILKLMRRTYNTSEYAEKVAMIRSYLPNAMIGADVIPGFPSETDEEFKETMSFIETIGLHYLHVFPYSKRPNTAAAKMPNHLNQSVVKQRSEELRKMSTRLKRAYLSQFIGSKVEVLWESHTDKQGRPIGHTKNYLETIAPQSAAYKAGDLSTVRLKGITENDRLLGTPCPR